MTKMIFVNLPVKDLAAAIEAINPLPLVGEADAVAPRTFRRQSENTTRTRLISKSS